MKRLPRIVKQCKYCGSTFSVMPCHADAKFCSHPCYSKNLAGQKRHPLSPTTRMKIGNANRGERNGMHSKKGLIPWNKGVIKPKLQKKPRIVPLNRMFRNVVAACRLIKSKSPHIPWNKGTKGIMPKYWLGKKRVDMIGNKYCVGKPAWNKGTKGLTGPNIKSFKKGLSPWNKGKRFLAITGEKNHMWKGGVATLDRRIRKCYKYINWRMEVFERDSFTCCMPGCQGTEKFLNAHHIKSFSLLLKKNKITTLEQAMLCDRLWYPDLGITLCKKCHYNIRCHEPEYATLFTKILNARKNT